MAQDQQDSPAEDQPSPPTAAEFDSEFAAADRSPGLRRVWQQAAPDLPPEIEPYSFVSVALLGHLGDALALSPGTTHDFRVDLIVTPDETIWCGEPHRPPGILWEHLDPDKIAKVPPLAALAAER